MLYLTNEILWNVDKTEIILGCAEKKQDVLKINNFFEKDIQIFFNLIKHFADYNTQ